MTDPLICPRCSLPLASLSFGPCLNAHVFARLNKVPLPSTYMDSPSGWVAPFAAEDYR